MSLVNYALTIIKLGLTEGIFHYISTKKTKTRIKQSSFVRVLKVFLQGDSRHLMPCRLGLL